MKPIINTVKYFWSKTASIHSNRTKMSEYFNNCLNIFYNKTNMLFLWHSK